MEKRLIPGLKQRKNKGEGEPGMSSYVRKIGRAQMGSHQKDRRVSLKEAPTGPIGDNWDILCTCCVIECNILNK